MANKDREFLPSWAMSWDDISDAQLADVIRKESEENARVIVGKIRAYYRVKDEARIHELKAALEAAPNA